MSSTGRGTTAGSPGGPCRRPAPSRPSAGRLVRASAAAVGALLTMGLVTSCSTASAPPAAGTEEARVESTGPVAPSASPTAPASPAIAEGVAPARIRAPAIALDEPLIDLGIDERGAMEVPTDFDDVGWFSGGGRPGGRGPTVIAAHVDSSTGPAVFFRLSELVVGDRLAVTDVQGGEHAYVVTEVEDVAKDAFPTARVFGAQPADQLRLITCGGVFDRSSGHYESNRIVFAEPAA
ncbi:class F sortase [Frigoribacterium sp. 2-23]|uniref:class F sortase n=1 Tax=Frigoribacterium sp. 2-23 TaxID=3415006 RepID=UPI003C6EF675